MLRLCDFQKNPEDLRGELAGDGELSREVAADRDPARFGLPSFRWLASSSRWASARPASATSLASSEAALELDIASAVRLAAEVGGGKPAPSIRFHPTPTVSAGLLPAATPTRWGQQVDR